MSSIDMAVWLIAIALQAIVAVLLVRRGIYRHLPILFSYIFWTIMSDLTFFWVRSQFPSRFEKLYLYEWPLDALLQFAVLVELAWSILRPLQRALPRSMVLIIAAILLLTGALVWPITNLSVPAHLSAAWHLQTHIQQTCSMLRILFFLMLVAGSQLLSIGWRDRELQIATGLGFYSLASLASAVLHAQYPQMALYHRIDQFVAMSYLASLLYWVVSFVQKEALRQEFSPQMQSFLLTVSGAARANRVALQENTLRHDRQP